MYDKKSDDEFHLDGGGNLSSLKDLQLVLNKMSQDTFKHHVNAEKNDFANWVEHCHKMHDLATDLRTCRSIYDMQEVLCAWNPHLYCTKNKEIHQLIIRFQA